MPVYEYHCEECGALFDVVATISEKEAGLSPSCPKCRCRRVKQVFGRFTVMTSSKSDSDDFDEDLDTGMPDESTGGTGGDFGGVGEDESGGLDDLDDLD